MEGRSAVLGSSSHWWRHMSVARIIVLWPKDFTWGTSMRIFLGGTNRGPLCISPSRAPAPDWETVCFSPSCQLQTWGLYNYRIWGHLLARLLASLFDYVLHVFILSNEEVSGTPPSRAVVWRMREAWQRADGRADAALLVSGFTLPSETWKNWHWEWFLNVLDVMVWPFTFLKNKSW